MSNEEKKLVPQLRFREFRNIEGWQIKRLKDISTPINEKAGSKKYTLLSVTAGIGLVSQIEKFGREIAGTAYKNYYVIKKGDFAYNKSSTKQHPEGQIALLVSHESGAVPNSIFTCFRLSEDNILPDFLKYPFANNVHGKWLRNFIQVGARANGALNIDNRELFALPVALPSLAEQQKVADCLSSIDDLITAQSQKVDALKKHRQGLLQLLFPAKGKMVPELRFPGFETAGDWEKKLLGNIAENLDYKRVPITGSDRVKGKIAYYGASGIIDYVKGYIFDDDLLCVSEDGANLVARTYPIAFSITGKTWVNNHAHVLKFEKYYTQVLVENYLNSMNIEDFLTGMAQPKLNRGQLDLIPLLLPKPSEQQKIADILLSVDDLINAQVEKLDALKEHKKGLMQQLYPIVAE